MTRPGIETWSPGPLANTLTIMPMSGVTVIIIGITTIIGGAVMMI